jgi:hypothetical protein
VQGGIKAGHVIKARPPALHRQSHNMDVRPSLGCGGCGGFGLVYLAPNGLVLWRVAASCSIAIAIVREELEK